NDTALFGFASAVEKQLFLKLISVKGLGPKTAMAMLARSSADKIIASIEQGDVASLKRLPGIGAKSASQIVLDLKGKLVEVPSGPKETKPVYSTAITEAMEGLKSLGYKPGEVNSAAAAMEKSEAKTKEEYLKIGLRFLMSTK
ncbi:MAG: Holliday junction branch migration protein RuvA, partial [Solobacterium sp.]|nr:Holliday junction branch migration protein RuvA [Solobacterium sp.]